MIVKSLTVKEKIDYAKFFKFYFVTKYSIRYRALETCLFNTNDYLEFQNDGNQNKYFKETVDDMSIAEVKTAIQFVDQQTENEKSKAETEGQRVLDG